MRSSRLPSPISPSWLVLALGAAIAPGCAEDDGRISDLPRSESQETEDGITVYETLAVRTLDGEILAWSEQGTWSLDLAERVARPWLHVDEGLVHDDEAWLVRLDENTFETGYRVTAKTIDPVDPPVWADTDPLSVGLIDVVAGVGSDAEIRVQVQFAGWSPEALPWVPHRATVSAEDYEAAMFEMRAAATARDEAFEDSIEALALAITESGGSIEGQLASVGWISARVPAGAIATLAARDDVRRIELDNGVQDGSHTGAAVSLKSLKSLSGSKSYHLAGYDGDLCDPLCGAGLILGVHESNGYEDEACFQSYWSACSPWQRMRSRFDCGASGCTYLPSGFWPAAEGEHGTVVAAIAMGDYSSGQAVGYESQIAPGLSNWEADASGFATSARLDYYRVGLAYSTGAWKAYECARGQGPSQCAVIDVMNESNGDPTGTCDAASFLPLEGAVEDAWDAGVLPVIITQNDNDYPNSDDCRVWSPADVPKALAVGNIDASFTAPYHTWIYHHHSSRGGGTSKIGGTSFPGAMSMVDLMASGRPGYVTDAGGDYGTIDVNGPSVAIGGSGTSFAAPQVAGAAIQVKERHLNLGQSWITNPGRLHAVMLAMGDRATLGTSGATMPSCITGSHLRCGADRYYGLGRLTLRMHPSSWEKSFTHTAATPATTKFTPWKAPLTAGRRLVKCVMQQAEDMVAPDKDDISRIGITLQIRDPNPSGICQTDVGYVHYTVNDDLPDDKHMVAVTDAEETLAGRCVQVTFSKWAISTAGAVTTHSYCVSDDFLDNE